MNDTALSDPALPVFFFAGCGLAFTFDEIGAFLGFAIFATLGFFVVGLGVAAFLAATAFLATTGFLFAAAFGVIFF